MLLALSLGVLQFLNHLLLITSLEEVTWGESERFVGHRIMIKYSFLNGQLENGHWEKVINCLMEYLFFFLMDCLLWKHCVCWAFTNMRGSPLRWNREEIIFFSEKKFLKIMSDLFSFF